MIATHQSNHSMLRILLISDGRPGHFNLSEGIVAAITRRRPVELNRLEVRRPKWIAGPVLAALTNAKIPAARMLKSVFGVDAIQLGKPDLIVSAGGNTLAANIAAARLTSAANVFYGSLRQFRARDFSLSMTSYSADATAPNRIMWLKPSCLDPAKLAPESSPAQQVNTFGLIIGGNSGTVHYSDDDWNELLAFLKTDQQTRGSRWVVANAPRTPSEVSDKLLRLAGDTHSPIVRFIDFRTSGPGTLGNLLSQSSSVLCTADSSTMLSETVWMQRPVIAITPRDFALPKNEVAYRDWMEENNWTRQLAITNLTPDTVAQTLSEVIPLAGNPLDRLAGELEARLPGLLN